MKLLHAPNSPYSRKCRVVIREKGLSVEEVVAMPTENPKDLWDANPMGTVPALVGEGGEYYSDSPLICEYLDSLPSGANALFPSGKNRFQTLQLAALGDGIMDAAVQVFLEQRRPADKRSQEWVDRKEAAIMRAIGEAAKMNPGPELNIATIGLACALDYVRFRIIHLDWQGAHPGLAKWLDAMVQHPSFAATAPLP